MKFKFFLFLSILLILYIYSSEISFMPNYEYRPDKFHLFIPMLGFYITLISQLIWSIIEKIKKKKNYLNILLIVISILLFTFLNNPKGSFQSTGYCGLIIISIVSIILSIMEDKKELATKTIPKV